MNEEIRAAVERYIADEKAKPSADLYAARVMLKRCFVEFDKQDDVDFDVEMDLCSLLDRLDREYEALPGSVTSEWREIAANPPR